MTLKDSVYLQAEAYKERCMDYNKDIEQVRRQVYPRDELFDRFFMHVAIESSHMSTCATREVGCVLVADRRILSTGYNGSPAGLPHCNLLFDYMEVENDEKIHEKHHIWSRTHELHAEVNAVIDAGKRGTLKPNMTAYVTLAPCIDCAKLLVAAGIIRLVYMEEPTNLSYAWLEAKHLFKECGIQVDHYNEI